MSTPDQASSGSASDAPATPPSRLSRRGLLGVVAGSAAGLAVGAGTGFTAGAAMGRAATNDKPGNGTDPAGENTSAATLKLHGGERISCHGPHQAGIITPRTAHVRYLAFDLRPGTDATALRRLLRLLTGDIEALTAGAAPLADTEAELAELPARLTITVGFGRGFVEAATANAAPDWLAPLPDFSRDELDPAFGDGDLLLVIASDDQVTIAHAARFLTKDLRSFVTPRWRQDGFFRARGSEPDGRTMRNLMGQVDGTVNPRPEEADFAGLVWIDAAETSDRPGHSAASWLDGGSALVIRRIRMELDTWDRVDRVGREQSVGRKLDTGAPLTGEAEHDEADFEATDRLGFTVIPSFSHIARARSEDPDERIYRRAANYDDEFEQGLIFACYQRNPLTQFVPIQRRLDELDLLNEWITHVGSAVFAIPPGWEPGGMVGETLLAPQ